MDGIKEAFLKVKQDIVRLQEEIQQTNQQVYALQRELQTILQHIPFVQQTESAQYPTHNQEKEGKYEENALVSTGNKGVPTNQPTIQQTNQQEKYEENPGTKPLVPHTKDKLNELSLLASSFQEAQQALIHQFKTLTKQEFTVYATIYQLQLEQKERTYRELASTLGITEISIRDYVHKISKKGIPLEKQKEHNKKVTLSIPESFTHIASLPSLVALYEK